MVKVLSLFTGIGAFEKALDNLGIEYELVNYSEIDKFASKSYCAIHNVDESLNLGDITKINEKELPKDIDLITYGFPCQDISLAGKQKGLLNEDGTKTRSGLFFDALRIIEETQPKVAIAENVKNLVGKKFKDQFEIVLDSLDKAGYNNYWEVLNAKDYGIPQNRERVFIVSIRKDIDNGKFEFPKPFELKLRLKDMLEDEVDEKYYLSIKGMSGIVNAMEDGRKHLPNIMNKETKYCSTLDTKVGAQTHRSPYIEETNCMQVREGIDKSVNNPKIIEVANCITAREDRGVSNRKGEGTAIIETKCIQVERTNKNGETVVTHLNMETEEEKTSAVKLGNVYNDKFTGGSDFGGNVWDKNGLAPTLKTSAAATQQFVMVKEATKKGYAEATVGDSINFEQPNSKTRRGRVGHGVAQTLTTSPQQGVVVNEQ